MQSVQARHILDSSADCVQGKIASCGPSNGDCRMTRKSLQTPKVRDLFLTHIEFQWEREECRESVGERKVRETQKRKRRTSRIPGPPRTNPVCQPQLQRPWKIYFSTYTGQTLRP